MTDTVLVLSGMGIAPFSCRGAQQTLEPIDAAANLRRTINGTLVDLSVSEFRKYKTSISCSDQLPPALDGVFPGAVLIVDCITELSYENTSPTSSPLREAVSGSERTEGDFTFYRPRLITRVAALSYTTDEYGAKVDWQLDLEEV
jgi:hypothetical protein